MFPLLAQGSAAEVIVWPAVGMEDDQPREITSCCSQKTVPALPSRSLSRRAWPSCRPDEPPARGPPAGEPSRTGASSAASRVLRCAMAQGSPPPRACAGAPRCPARVAHPAGEVPVAEVHGGFEGGGRVRPLLRGRHEDPELVACEAAQCVGVGHHLRLAGLRDGPVARARSLASLG